MKNIKITDIDYAILENLSQNTGKTPSQLISEIIAKTISPNIDKELSKMHKQNVYR